MSNGPFNWNAGGAQMDNSNNFGSVKLPPNMTGMQNVRPSYIPGKMISNPNDIVPLEVPMDGSAAIFPFSDLSCILLKAWGQDGTIKTFKFIPEQIDSGEKKPEENFQETVLGRLDVIENILKRRPYQKPFNKNNRYNQKKEDLNNESE